MAKRLTEDLEVELRREAALVRCLTCQWRTAAGGCRQPGDEERCEYSDLFDEPGAYEPQAVEDPRTEEGRGDD